MTSCIKETAPTSGALKDDVMSSPTAIEGMLNAIQVEMTAYASVAGNHYEFAYPSMYMITDVMTGDVISTAGEENAGYSQFWAWEYGVSQGATYGSTTYIWYSYYSFIKAANDVIGVLSGIAEEDLTDLQRSYIAYAKLYRAQMYLDLARMYEPFKNEFTEVEDKLLGLTVPIVTEATSELDARNNPRVSRAELFSFIFDDIDYAIAALKGVRTNKTLPGEAVAYGIKARALLWLGGFQNETVNKTEGIHADYVLGDDAYAAAAVAARKAIDLSGCTIMTEQQWLNKTSGFNQANSAWMWYLPQSSENVNNLLNYIAMMSFEVSGSYGEIVLYGVTSKFYDAIPNSDWRKRAFVAPKARYSDYADLTNYDEEMFANVTPYANLKFHPAGGVMNDFKTSNVTDIPMMRVEEMYLIEAEATAHVDYAAGKTLFQEFVSHRDPKGVAVSSADGLIQAIIRCKQLEFWGEGIIFYDKKRLGYGMETGYDGTNACSYAQFATEGMPSWWNFVIPEDETEVNLALQNFNNPDPSYTVPWYK